MIAEISAVDARRWTASSNAPVLALDGGHGQRTRDPEWTPDELVLRNQGLVVRIAQDYRDRGLPLGDLISEGNIGLMRAAQLFNPARNVRFSCYAGPWVRVHMKRALSYQAWPVSLPADFSWRQGRVHGAETRLGAKLHRSPCDSEVAAESGVGIRAVRHFRNTQTPQFVSLGSSSTTGNQLGLTPEEVIPDETAITPYEQAAANSDREFLQSVIALLNPVEQRVIRSRYGLDDGCARTLDEVAQTMGYVRQGIHRLERAALKKMRQHLQFMQLTPVSNAPR